MKKYKPSDVFHVPVYLFKPEIIIVKGSAKKIYPDKGEKIYCSFKTFGGTEKIIDNVLSVENTAVIETRYRPDIRPDCIIRTADGVSYEIIGSPENISMRNQYLKFKVRCIKGGA